MRPSGPACSVHSWGSAKMGFASGGTEVCSGHDPGIIEPIVKVTALFFRCEQSLRFCGILRGASLGWTPRGLLEQAKRNCGLRPCILHVLRWCWNLHNSFMLHGCSCSTRFQKYLEECCSPSPVPSRDSHYFVLPYDRYSLGIPRKVSKSTF